jgi:hypothetical protein
MRLACAATQHCCTSLAVLMTGELRSSAMLVHRPIGCGHWHVVLQRNTVVVLCLPMLSCIGDNPYLKQHSENWIQT